MDRPEMASAEVTAEYDVIWAGAKAQLEALQRMPDQVAAQAAAAPADSG